MFWVHAYQINIHVLCVFRYQNSFNFTDFRTSEDYWYRCTIKHIAETHQRFLHKLIIWFLWNLHAFAFFSQLLVKITKYPMFILLICDVSKYTVLDDDWDQQCNWLNDVKSSLVNAYLSGHMSERMVARYLIHNQIHEKMVVNENKDPPL